MGADLAGDWGVGADLAGGDWGVGADLGPVFGVGTEDGGD